MQLLLGDVCQSVIGVAVDVQVGIRRMQMMMHQLTMQTLPEPADAVRLLLLFVHVFGRPIEGLNDSCM